MTNTIPDLILLCYYQELILLLCDLSIPSENNMNVSHELALQTRAYEQFKLILLLIVMYK